jgi:hypothetical protein
MNVLSPVSPENSAWSHGLQLAADFRYHLNRVTRGLAAETGRPCAGQEYMSDRERTDFDLSCAAAMPAGLNRTP